MAEKVRSSMNIPANFPVSGMGRSQAVVAYKHNNQPRIATIFAGMYGANRTGVGVWAAWEPGNVQSIHYAGVSDGAGITTLSMQTDPEGNIHLVFNGPGNPNNMKVVYQRWNININSSTGDATWTMQPPETIESGNGRTCSRVDLDVNSDGVVCVGYTVQITSPASATHKLRARGTDGTWGNVVARDPLPNRTGQCMSICRGHEKFLFAMASTSGLVRFGRVNVTNKATGQITSTDIGSLPNNPLRAGAEDGHIFQVTAEEISGGAASGGEWVYYGRRRTSSDNQIRPVAVGLTSNGVTFSQLGSTTSTQSSTFAPGSVKAFENGNGVLIYPSRTALTIFTRAFNYRSRTWQAEKVTLRPPMGPAELRITWVGGGVGVPPGFSEEFGDYRDLTIYRRRKANEPYEFDDMGAWFGRIIQPTGVIRTGRPTIQVRGSASGQNQAVWAYGEFKARVEYQKLSGGTVFVTPDGTSVPSGSVSTTRPSAGQALTQGETPWILTPIPIDSVSGLPNRVHRDTQSVTVTVSHPPTAVQLYPLDLEPRVHGSSVRVAWKFTDPWDEDYQLAYLVTAYDDGVLVHASGVTPGNAESYDIPTTPAMKDREIEWSVMVWDSDGIISEEATGGSFVTHDPPVVEIVEPEDGSVLDAPNPMFLWNFIASAGRTQRRWRLDIIDRIDGAPVGSYGWFTGSQGEMTQFQVPEMLLENEKKYQATLRVEDNLGIAGEERINFDTSWVTPEPPATVVADNGWNNNSMEEDGFLRVSWSIDPNDLDEEFHSWRIYRNLDYIGGYRPGHWELIHEDLDSEYSGTFLDHTAPSNTEVRYIVVQVASRFGGVIESNFYMSPMGATTGPGSSYWLSIADSPDEKLRVHHVTADEFSEEYETEVYGILGGGRKVERGDRMGIAGSLQASLRHQGGIFSARVQKLALMFQTERSLEFLLRTPFGDIYRVALSDIQYTRVPGRGPEEDLEVSMEYYEVGR